jgi:hypothetical protein
MKLRNNVVVSYLKSPVYMAKEVLHRMPESGYSWRFAEGPAGEKARAGLDVLRRDGIVILPEHFTGERLERLKSSFHNATDGKVNPYTPDSLYNEDVMQDPAFLDAAVDDTILEIVGGYYRRRFGIGRASVSRLMPTPPVRHSSYSWHHDARGRQLHMMLLLSDVTSNGQRMSYLKGSQNRYYSHYRGIVKTQFDNDLNAESVSSDRIAEVVGKAGTVAIFDANGLHSGNRNDKELRDTLTFCYVSKKHFKTIRCRAEDVNALPPLKRELVVFNPLLVQTN